MRKAVELRRAQKQRDKAASKIQVYISFTIPTLN